jgi:putative copper export protein
VIYTLELLHLIAAAVWLGGLITLGAAVAALRRAGVDREVLRAVARQFARVSWVAMAVAVITGLVRAHLLHVSWSYGRLHLKLGLVALVIVTALVHQLTARRSSAAVRGVVQLVILALSLGIFAAAVRL